VNFFFCVNVRTRSLALVRGTITIGQTMRFPAFSHGTTSFFWALGLAVYIWLGGMAIGMSRATAVVLAAVAGCAIFLYVRLYGEDDPRRPW
jgi:hypothetical protein